MSCASLSVSRSGGCGLAAIRSGGLAVSAARRGGSALSARRTGGSDARTEHTGGTVLVFGIVCSAGAGGMVLSAADGRILTVDGGYLIIPKW